MKQRIMELIKSADQDMVVLGIQLALNKGLAWCKYNNIGYHILHGTSVIDLNCEFRGWPLYTKDDSFYFAVWSAGMCLVTKNDLEERPYIKQCYKKTYL